MSVKPKKKRMKLYPSWRLQRVYEEVERVCLGVKRDDEYCEKPFIAPNRFTRLCPECHAKLRYGY